MTLLDSMNDSMNSGRSGYDSPAAKKSRRDESDRDDSRSASKSGREPLASLPARYGGGGSRGEEKPRRSPSYSSSEDSDSDRSRSDRKGSSSRGSGRDRSRDRSSSRYGDRDRRGDRSYRGEKLRRTPTYSSSDDSDSDRSDRKGSSRGSGRDRSRDRSSDRYSKNDRRDDRRGGYGDRDRDRGDYRGRDRGDDRGDRRGYGDSGRRGGDDRGGRYGGDRYGNDRNRGGYGNSEAKYERKSFAGKNSNYGGNRSFGGGRPSGADHLEVEMNALKISSQRLDSVKRFHVDIIKSFKGKDKDIARGMKHDQAYIAKEMCVFGIMKVMYKTLPQLFGSDKYCHAYDGGYTLYSIGCTVDKLEDGSMSHVFSKEDVARLFPEAVTTYLGKCDSLKVSMKATGEVFIRGPNFNKDDNYREAIKFFEVVTDCYLHEGNFLNYTTKSFDKRGFNKEIGGAKVVKKGLDKNVRLIGDSVDSGVQLVLQASSKASAFHMNLSVFEYLAEILNCREKDVPRYLAKEKRDCEKATGELKNVFVACTHIKRSFVLRKIDFKQTAESTFFENKEMGRISVAEYYKSHHNIHLKYPECPMAVETKPGGSSFFPLELLEVMEGQRVGTANLGKDAEKVHQVARALPTEQKTNTMKQLDAARLRHGENPYLEAFGISLDSEFIRYDAKVLAPPVRIGGNSETCVAASRSKMRQFFNPARTDKKIIVCALDKCMRDDDVKFFYKRFSQAAITKGLKLPSSATIIQAYSEGDIKKYFKEWARKDDVALAVFITKEKLDNVHHPLKLMETEFGVCTEHMWVGTVRKCMDDRGGAATVENVLRKFNMKLGGINECVAPNTKIVPRGIDPQDFAEKILNNRLFIGLEMSHPAAQSLFDRQNDVELGQPTIIGMSFSLDLPSRLGGFSWFQKPRCHNILKLCDKFKEALDACARMRKVLPKEIVVYRGGGSEGEFEEIRKEVDQMRAATRSFENGAYNPKITYVVVMANSNNMIIPANLPQRKIPANQANVPSGTLIDGGVTNPTLCEFILVSQEGNIGTSRPMRCVVLVNEAEIPKEEVYQVTYYLCYAHQASTQPTSKPNVLYAANELAKRGKNNWSSLMDRNGGGSMYSGASGVKYDIQPGEEVDAYFERKSAEAKNRLPATYWA